MKIFEKDFHGALIFREQIQIGTNSEVPCNVAVLGSFANFIVASCPFGNVQILDSKFKVIKEIDMRAHIQAPYINVPCAVSSFGDFDKDIAISCHGGKVTIFKEKFGKWENGVSYAI